MNVKRFFGRNSREAMQKVRQAFGDNAVVLSTKPSSSGIEIVAMPAESIDAIERFESGPAAQADERFEDDLHEAEPMPDSFDAAPTDASAQVQEDVGTLAQGHQQLAVNKVDYGAQHGYSCNNEVSDSVFRRPCIRVKS